MRFHFTFTSVGNATSLLRDNAYISTTLLTLFINRSKIKRQSKLYYSYSHVTKFDYKLFPSTEDIIYITTLNYELSIK